MTILLTGVAGFIGSHVAAMLLDRGEEVLGIDDLNSYYDPALKAARLAQLEGRRGFTFRRIDIADREAVQDLIGHSPAIDRIVHLAAQAGVRYSLEAPHSYTRTNVEGHLCLLELARHLPGLTHMVYASSSSVYGGNHHLPFSEADRVDTPLSLYAATKRAGELMAHTYAHLYRLPLTGLRFFTVYGPWGRPDMSAWLFTDAILTGRPIRVFNQGRMQRDFTYIDDIVSGVIAALDLPPPDGAGEGGVPHRVFNLGNNAPVALEDFIRTIERACGREAVKVLEPMQPGDVQATYAEIGPARQLLGFEPRTPISEGIPRFVEWFRAYHGN
ncbi:NAD-dependent epimerase/dehydratase family protein [uncultured Tistrella sp.]|uniref:NAD-dependent epimerase/dehydratase family protein n=1 Tax=Tistrella mobilis TaxID=171437 RepID=UPI000C08F02A|nr:NAD-dependent epimerase/dehydratase family protein [uncultured Tistrella sp.]MAM74523.1 protein CapI [Tistrella sp.]